MFMHRTTIRQRGYRLYDKRPLLMMDLAGLILPVANQLESGDVYLNPGEKMARTKNLSLGQECLTLCVDRLIILQLTRQVVLQMTARGSNLLTQQMAFLTNRECMNLGICIIQLVQSRFTLLDLAANFLLVSQ